MQAIRDLQQFGYAFLLHNGKIHYSFNGAKRPDNATVKPLFDHIKVNKPEALSYLQQYFESTQTSSINIKDTLLRRGYVTIYSVIMREIVYFCRDNNSALKLPGESIAFTLQELKNIITQNYTPEELQKLCEAKREILIHARQRQLAEQAERLFDGVMMDLEDSHRVTSQARQ